MRPSWKRESLEKWTAAAIAVEQPIDNLGAPFAVFASEALDAARFVIKYWEPRPTEAGSMLPGLGEANLGERLPITIVEEIHELHDALQAAQTDTTLAVERRMAAPMDRALFLLGELRETLAWVFDDDALDVTDAQLEKLRRVHDHPRTHSAVAAALFDYAGLAELHAEAIRGVAGFDTGVIDEAREVAMELRTRPKPVEISPKLLVARDLRNRVATLLHQRVHAVRRAARLVFRRHPKVAHEATSDHRRQARARKRRERHSGVEKLARGTEPTGEVTTAS